MSRHPFSFYSFRLYFLSVIITLQSCSSEPDKSQASEPVADPKKEIPALKYILKRSFKHDTTSYTQGLLVADGQLYESTGSPAELPQTRSLVGRLDTISGKIRVGAELDRQTYFGEGIAVLNNTLYQLTYKNQLGFIYDLKTFKSMGQFGFISKEGWGLTSDGSHLIMSDGTSKIKYIDPKSFKEVRSLEVSNNGYTEEYLNELEFMDGHIFANVYGKNYIVRIDTAKGEVNGILDLSALVSKAKMSNARSEVLNGIAFNGRSRRVFVTGKLWPEMYEIEILK